MGLFGPNRAEIWRQVSAQVGAQYVDGGFWHGDKVVAKHGAWTIVLDTYTQSTGDSSISYTRIRALYVNPSGFRFEIYRRGLFSNLGKMMGMQDVIVGHQPFDDNFIIKGNDENRLRALFNILSLRELIEAQPDIHLSVQDNEGFFDAHFPEDADELRFQVVGDITSVKRLQQLFELFFETLEQLCRIGAATDQAPNVKL